MTTTPDELNIPMGYEPSPLEVYKLAIRAVLALESISETLNHTANQHQIDLHEGRYNH